MHLLKRLFPVPVFAAGLPLSVQSQSMPANEPPAPDGTVVLSPFEVRTDQDVGYVATSTLAGSRLNTPLEKTPVAISVLTSELISDIGATNIEQAMEYATNAGNDIGDFTGLNLTRNDFLFQIRGYRNVQATREYFPTLIGSDAFNIERIDIARGPNSILFGIGGAGGIIDTTPKRANLQRDFTQVELWTARWNKQRARIDANQALIEDRLAVRLNVMGQDADGYRDFEEDDQKRGALAVQARLGETTSLRLQGEVGDLHQNRVRPWAPYEQISDWAAAGSRFFPFGTPEIAETEGDDSFTQFVPGGTLRTFGVGRQGVLTDAGGNPLNYQPQWFGQSNAFGFPAQGQRFYRRSYANNLAGFNNPRNLEDESVFPRSGNPVGPGNYTDTDYYLASAFLDQQIGRLFLQASVSRQQVKTFRAEPVGFAQIALGYDVTTTLPTFNADRSWNGVLSPNAVETPVGLLGGVQFNESMPNPYVGDLMIWGNPSTERGRSVRDDYRLSGNYEVELDRLGTHNLLAFVSRAKEQNESQGFFETNIAADRPNPDYTHSFNTVLRLAHIDPFSESLPERGMPDPLTHPIPAGRMYGAPEYGFEDGWVRGGWGKTWQTVDSAALAVQSSFWEGRVVTTAGVRWDSIEEFQADTEFDETTGEALGFERRATPDTDESEQTHTLGAVVALTPQVSVYGNRSTNFRPQGGVLYGDENEQQLIGPVTGKGSDAGFKFRLLNDRVYATVGWFRVKQENQSQGFNGLVDQYIDAIWTTIVNNGPGEELEDPHNAFGSDTVATVSDGYELEVVANLTPSWRLMFNVSKAENVTSGVDSRLIEYVEQHRAEWEQYRSLPYNTGRPPGILGNNTVGALLDDLDQQIAYDLARNDQPEVNARPWNANLFTTYTLRDGPLRGLTVGGGANYRGEAILGIDTTDPLNHRVVKGRSYYLVNAMLAYELKPWRGVKTKVQLNVDNLLDNDDLQVLASNFSGGTANLLTYYFEPRRYSLSVTFDF